MYHVPCAMLRRTSFEIMCILVHNQHGITTSGMLLGHGCTSTGRAAPDFFNFCQLKAQLIVEGMIHLLPTQPPPPVALFQV